MKKKISILLSVILVIVLVFPSIVRAAQFESGNDVRILQPTENLYVSGGTINVISEVQKDLIAAGGNISIEGAVERNIIAAGGNINISSPFVGASVRVAGGNVTISGVINEDILVAGGTVVLDNAVVNGDVYATSENLTIIDSTINGSISAGYQTLEGDLESQVQGEIMTQTFERTDEAVAEKNRNIFSNVFLPWEFSIVIFLAIASFILYKKGRLEIPSLGFKRQFAWDIFIGFNALFLPILILIISLVTFLFPIILPLVAIIYLAIPISFVFLPIYIANVIKNSFKLTMDIRTLVALSYASMFLVTLVPIFAPLKVVIFIFAVANIGFLARMDYHALQNYLEPRKKNKKS